MAIIDQDQSLAARLLRRVLENALPVQWAIFWGLVILASGTILLLNLLDLTSTSLGEGFRCLWPAARLCFGVTGAIDGVMRGLRTESGENRGILWGTGLVNGLVAVWGLVELAQRNGWVFGPYPISPWQVLIPLVLILFVSRLLLGGLERPGSRTVWVTWPASP